LKDFILDFIPKFQFPSPFSLPLPTDKKNFFVSLSLNISRFAYSHKLDKSADSSDSGCAESAKTLSPEEHRKIEEHIPSTNTEEEEIDTFNENENAFAESAKSMRLSAKHLQKLAATFGGSGAENLDLGESGELDSVYGHSVRRQCASAMSESANTDRVNFLYFLVFYYILLSSSVRVCLRYFQIPYFL